MKAFAYNEDGTRRPIDPRGALLTAHHGTPIHLEGALQAFGLLDTYIEAFLTEIAALTSAAIAAHLRAVGLQHLHEVMPPDAVAEMLTRLDRKLAAGAAVLARQVTTATTTEPRPHYFVCQRIFVRAQVPVRLLDDYPALRTAGHLGGHLRPIEMHRDVDFTHPRDSLSIWCAVGPIQRGNSMVLFSEARNTTFALELAPGDLVVFNADRLHGSVPNRTDETRVGVGTRVVLGRWLRYGPGTHWRPWADASLLGTPLEPLATVQSRMTTAAYRRWRWRRQWRRTQTARAVQAAE